MRLTVKFNKNSLSLLNNILRTVKLESPKEELQNIVLTENKEALENEKPDTEKRNWRKIDIAIKHRTRKKAYIHSLFSHEGPQHS